MDRVTPKEKIKHYESLRLLKTARGQLNRVITMVEQNEYCIDISTQLMAVISLLKKANVKILSKHMETCVKDAFTNNDKNILDLKIEEIQQIIKYLSRT